MSDKDLTPKVGSALVPLEDIRFKFRLSAEAREQMAAITRRNERARNDRTTRFD